MIKRVPKRNKYSLIKQLISEGKISEDDVALLNSLTLEEVIGLKLEASVRLVNNKLYGTSLFHSMKYISESAILKYAFSACRTQEEAANFLGITRMAFLSMIEKHRTKNYFEKEE